MGNNFGDFERSMKKFQRELEKSGVVGALRRAGAQEGDEVRIGEVVFDFR